VKGECYQEDVLSGLPSGVKGIKKNNFLRSWKMSSSSWKGEFYKVYLCKNEFFVMKFGMVCMENDACQKVGVELKKKKRIG